MNENKSTNGTAGTNAHLSESPTGRARRSPEAPPSHLAEQATKQEVVLIDLKAEDFRPRVHTLPVNLIGRSPLIVNNFNQKIRTQILDGHKGIAKEKKAPKDPSKLFEGSKYIDDQGRDCLPIASFRNAMISAARTTEGMKMVTLKQCFFLEGPGGPGQTLLPIEYEACVMREDAVRNQSGVADIRIRAEYQGWRTKFVIHCLANVLSPAQVFNLLANAGMFVGVCEWRPGAKEGNGGIYGCFDVV